MTLMELGKFYLNDRIYSKNICLCDFLFNDM